MCHIGICANSPYKSIAGNIPRIIKCNFRENQIRQSQTAQHSFICCFTSSLARFRYRVGMSHEFMRTLAYNVLKCTLASDLLCAYSFIRKAFGKLGNMLLEMQNHHQSKMT